MCVIAMVGCKNSGGYCKSVIGYLDQQNNTMGVFYLAIEMPVNARDGMKSSATIAQTIARNALRLKQLRAVEAAHFSLGCI